MIRTKTVSIHGLLKFILPAIILCMLASQLSALDVPALNGRVNDYAGMISDNTEQELNRKLAELEKSDSTQIVVLTIPSLEGDALENFSIRVAESWKIGRKKYDNGVILLAVKNDRKIRIEVGYGLEGKMTDLVSGRIIDTIMKPAFRAGDYDRGFVEATEAIIAVSRGEFTAPPAEENNNSRGAGVVFLVFILGLFFGSQRRWTRSISGAALLPLAAVSIALPVLWSLVLIPVGALTGFFLHPFLPRMEGGFGGGGSSGGGFGGGFSGGGGGFGGGGASGSW